MSRRDICPGSITAAGARYNNMIMDKQDEDEFYARAAMVRDSDEYTESESELDLDSPDLRRDSTMNAEARTASEVAWRSQIQLTICAQSTSRTRAQRKVPKPLNVLWYESSTCSGSLRSRQPARNTSIRSLVHSNLSRRVEENVFCDPCQTLREQSLTVEMDPKRANVVDQGGGVTVLAEQNEDGDQEILVEVFSHHASLGALRQSGLDGCHLCSILAARDLTAPEDLLSDRALSYKLLVVREQSYHSPGWIEVRIRKHGVVRTVTKISLSYGNPSVQLHGSLKHTRTDSEEVFKLAKMWLDDCLQKHEKCRHASRGNWFHPTRLLKITASGSSLVSVQLCLTSTEDFEPSPYLALSHCWGGSDILQLTSSTLPTYLNNIPLTILPQTFTDAALTTTRLGYSYLWIDSLCILQDSSTDQSHEIATMGSVYTNATCTIAALSATDSHGGCFVTRNPLSHASCCLRDGRRGRTSIWADPHPPRAPDSQGDLRPPLLTRAWVVQERALAPRTLYFGEEMLYWECVEGRASEARPSIEGRTYVRRKDDTGGADFAATLMGLKATLFTLKELCWTTEWEEWEPFWWKLVRHYTAGKLTFDSDRWHAFSGLADAVQQPYCRTKLYHGLWESNLFDELLWRVLTPGRRFDFDCPTWSWLSIDVPAVPRRYNYTMDFRRVATVSIPPSSTNPTSPTQRKAITVSGQLLRITHRVAHSGSGVKTYKFRLRDKRDMHQLHYDGFWKPDVPPEESWELYTLQFVMSEWQESYGLVVRRVGGKGAVERRVGVSEGAEAGGNVAESAKGSVAVENANWETWTRVGYYGTYWRRERDLSGELTKRWFGDVETIVLV